MRVNYRCGIAYYREWVCIEHGGFAGRKAAIWWTHRDDGPGDFAPMNTDDAVSRAAHLKTPKRLMIDISGQYSRILRYEFEKGA